MSITPKQQPAALNRAERRFLARPPRTQLELLRRAAIVNRPGYSDDPIAGPCPHQPLCVPTWGCTTCSQWRIAARRGLTMQDVAFVPSPMEGV